MEAIFQVMLFAVLEQYAWKDSNLVVCALSYCAGILIGKALFKLLDRLLFS